MQEFLHGTLAFILCVIPLAAIMMLARHFLKIPDELFRKVLHCILLIGYFPFLFAFDTWWLSVTLVLGLMVVAYPILALCGKLPAFSSFVNERKQGEFKSSLVLAMLMMALSITNCWGILGDRLLVLACIYAWGVGDAFAALVGKRFGKHKVKLPFADPRKSWEGSAAMFLCSVISVLTVLLFRGGLAFGSCLLVAIPAAIVTTYVELITKGGLDTITCPTAAMAVILPLIQILGG